MILARISGDPPETPRGGSPGGLRTISAGTTLLVHTVSKSITTLPRHPDDAHLVAVQLKRKVEYKNSHLEGFIRPNVIIKALKTLKERGNRFYQDIKINENFMENNEIPPMEMDVDDAESQRIEREEDEAWEMNKKQEDELKAKLELEAEEGDSDNEFDTVLKSVKKFQSNQTNYRTLCDSGQR